MADAALREAVRTTFDRIDSDGCMSTNDTVVLLASGASGVTPAAGRVRGRAAELSAPTSSHNCWPTPKGRPRTS